MQNTADLGCPDDFSRTKNPLSLLFNNKTEVMRFRVLRFESEFKQSFRHLHFWASSLSSVIPFPLYLLSCPPAPRFPITAVVNRALHRNTSDQAAMATRLISNIGCFCLCYISPHWSSEKCPEHTSPEKTKCHNKGICWISNLWHSWKESRVPVPWDLVATVQTPPGNTV